MVVRSSVAPRLTASPLRDEGYRIAETFVLRTPKRYDEDGEPLKRYAVATVYRIVAPNGVTVEVKYSYRGNTYRRNEKTAYLPSTFRSKYPGLAFALAAKRGGKLEGEAE